jgi:hypothetical protein
VGVVESGHDRTPAEVNSFCRRPRGSQDRLIVANERHAAAANADGRRLRPVSVRLGENGPAVQNEIEHADQTTAAGCDATLSMA